MNQDLTEKQDQQLTAQQRDFMNALEEIGVKPYQYKTIKDNMFPDASPAAVVSYLRYCSGRKLDPYKRPAHIVPMWDRVKDPETGQWTSRKREVVLPGIYEYRTTAARTGLYGGHSQPQYGDNVMCYGRKVPEWVAMTFYRWNPLAKQWTAFPIQTWFEEVAGTVPEFELNEAGYPKKNDKNQKIPTGNQLLNARWSKAPRQMLVKCCEAAGLREAFPEELGGEPTADEMDAWTGQPVESEGETTTSPRASLQDRLAGAKPQTVTASAQDGVTVSDAMGAEVIPTQDQRADAELREVENGAQEAPEGAHEPEPGEAQDQGAETEETAQAAPQTRKKGKKKRSTKKKPAEPEQPDLSGAPTNPPDSGAPADEYTKERVLELMDEAANATELAYAIAKAEGLSEAEQDEVKDYYRSRISELNKKQQENGT